MGTDRIQRKSLLAWSIGTFVFWTLLISGFFFFFQKHTWDDALITGREIGISSLHKDAIHRFWNAGHGGVYVPVSKETPPNPYLSHIPERDITTPSGKKLTLMNPAYMTRQVYALEKEKYGVQSHITSLNTIRPENAADAWESKALERFEEGESEVVELFYKDDVPYMRLMTSLTVQKSCLKCHASQGYKEGDIRGGISVVIPMQNIVFTHNNHFKRALLFNLFIYFSGVLFLIIYYCQTRSQLAVRAVAEKKLRDQGNYLQGIIDNISDGIAVFAADNKGEDFTYKSINPKGLTISRLPEEAIVGKKISAVFPEVRQHGLSDALQRVWTTGLPERLPLTLYSDARITQWMKNSLFKLPTGEVVVVYEDLTEFKRLEEELSQAQKLEAIGTLAGGIAHDFNNILSVILGYAEIASMSLPEDSPAREDVEQVITAAERATDLVNKSSPSAASLTMKNNP